MKIKFTILSLLSLCTILSSSAFAKESFTDCGCSTEIEKKIQVNVGSAKPASICETPAYDAEGIEKKFYVGGNIGYSGPLKASFEDAGTKSVFSIKKTPMYTGLIGYKITPDVMIEFTGEYKPKYRLGIKLPGEAGGDKALTRAESQIFMINAVYNLKELSGGFQPYFSVGLGVARVKVKEVGVPFDMNAYVASTAGPGNTPIPVEVFVASTGGFTSADKFRTQKHTANCFAWEIGLGVSKPITDDFEINLGGKLQIAHNVKIRYKSINQADTTAAFQATQVSNAATGTRNATTPVYTAGEIKKTLGVGEATIGFTYHLPF